MTKLEKLRNMKENLKNEGIFLRELKRTIANEQKANEYAGDSQCTLIEHTRIYRHKHIAYCLELGTEYSAIEKTVREGNKPSWSLINEFRENLQGDL